MKPGSLTILTLMTTVALGNGFAVSASGQGSNAASPSDASDVQSPGGQGSRWGGRGGWGGGMGQGLGGTVTEVATDHYTIKTDAGETYIIHYSENTRILKQVPRARGENRGEGPRGEGGGTPPQVLKPADIKTGDIIAAVGEVDAKAKSVGAVMVMQIDPERAKQMREMRANFGKTWLMGKVTAIDGVKVTIIGGVEHASYSFVADEDTTFRKRREPITLADIQVGDMVRAEGSLKGGAFIATAVNAMGPPPPEGANGPHEGTALPQ